MSHSIQPRRRTLLVGLFLALLTATSGLLAEEPTFRDLTRKYFKDGDGTELAKLVGYSQPVKKVIALDYKVLLYRDNESVPVDPKTYEFKVGDKIRVAIEPLNDYFVYIFHIGASGESEFLVPAKDENPPLAKAGVPVGLPDDGFLEFSDPPGEEILLVVASEKPIADRAVLAKVLSKKSGEADTPEEKAVRATLKATVKKALKSVSERQQELLDKTVSWRGLTNDQSREEMVADVKKRGVSEGTFEEPGIGTTGSTSAVYASEKADEQAKLLVSIPLKSTKEPPPPKK